MNFRPKWFPLLSVLIQWFLLLLITCSLLIPLFVGVWFLVDVLLYCSLLCVQSSFSVISLRKRELVALLNCLPADFWLLVFCVAVNWSALSDCGISWSYLLTVWSFLVYQKINPFFCVSCLTVCQTVNYLTAIIDKISFK